jgi:hypothetical protein
MPTKPPLPGELRPGLRCRIDAEIAERGDFDHGSDICVRIGRAGHFHTFWAPREHVEIVPAPDKT